MQERPSDLASSTRFPKKLIMVIEQDEEIGTQFVQLIRQETPYQAILATSLLHVRNILRHLTCDFFCSRMTPSQKTSNRQHCSIWRFSHGRTMPGTKLT